MAEPLPSEEQLVRLIQKAHWQTARTVEHIPGGQHQYVVKRDRDALTEPEFWAIVEAIRAKGRLEEWTPPEVFYDSGNRRPQRNHYLYVGDHAYWVTKPRNGPWMLNREHQDVQRHTPTRRPVGEPPTLAGNPDLEQLTLQEEDE